MWIFGLYMGESYLGQQPTSVASSMRYGTSVVTTDQLHICSDLFHSCLYCLYCNLLEIKLPTLLTCLNTSQVVCFNSKRIRLDNKTWRGINRIQSRDRHLHYTQIEISGHSLGKWFFEQLQWFVSYYNGKLGNKFRWLLNRYTAISTQEYQLENVICLKAIIASLSPLSQPRFVNIYI